MGEVAKILLGLINEAAPIALKALHADEYTEELAKEAQALCEKGSKLIADSNARIMAKRAETDAALKSSGA